MLGENPKLKFKNEGKNPNVKMTIFENGRGYIRVNCDRCRDGIDGNIKLTDEWQLVQQPVTFMEAVNSGKKIRYEEWDTFYGIKSVFETMSYKELSVVREMLNGTWYIEDGE